MTIINHRTIIIVGFLFQISWGLAQQNYNSMHPFFKDRMYSSTNKLEAYSGNGFYPINEDEYNLTNKIADTTRQYNTFSYILFQKHLLEFKGENYYLTISPTFDFSYGIDLLDTAKRRLFQNTRGFHIEGDLFKNFSFSTSLYENQSRNALYQSQYFSGSGEMYVNHADSSYFTQNAVIPGSGRTKPFKGDAFDYGYAIGNIVYKPFKALTLSAGNTAHFIGDGYRSMLLSDNSYSAPYYQINYRFLPKWEFIYLRTRSMNLLRKPASTSVEAYYEPKGYAVNYLSFQATKKLSISLFEGTIYSRGDSITSKNVHPLYYNPVPLLSSFLLKEQEVNSIIGLNIGFTVIPTTRIYGQIAYNNFSNGVGGQLGARFSEPFKLKNLFIQLEINYAADHLYSSETSRLNYSHYNLPLAHTKGQGFAEGILRINYEWKRMYVDAKSINYVLTNYNDYSLLPVESVSSTYNGNVFHTTIEIGYRFNRKMNFSVFANGLLRTDTHSTNPSTFIVSFGIKTSLINHYFDF